MKKAGAVGGLLVRTSFYKVVLLVALIMGAEEWFFINKMNSYNRSGINTNFESLINESHMADFYAVAILFLMVLLIFTGVLLKREATYTIERIGIRKKYMFLVWMLYDSACFFFLMCMQMLVIFAAGYLFISHTGNLQRTTAAIPIAFMENVFLSEFMPVHMYGKLARNFAGIIATGAITAGLSLIPRRKKL